MKWFLLSFLCACQVNVIKPVDNASSGGSSGGSTGAHATSSGGSTGGAALTPDTFLSAFVAIGCTDSLPSCCANSGFSFAASGCEADFTSAFPASSDKATFQPAAAAACLSAFSAAAKSCSIDAATSRACDSKALFVGSVAPGGACTADSDCSSAGYCNNDNPGSQGFCVAQTETTSVGADCEQAPSAASPTVASCGAGLYCTVAEAQPTCQPLVSSGGDCIDLEDCVAGFYCDATERCTALLAANAPCTSADSCVDGDACDPSGHCAAQVALNGACDPNATWSQCVNDSNCDATVNRCIGDSAYANVESCGGSDSR